MSFTLFPRTRLALALDSLAGLSVGDALGAQYQLVRELGRGAMALGVAGGDGTLADVAQVAADEDVPFVAVPFGTRNHFARDAGYDREDPLAALPAFTEGVERRVDIGELLHVRDEAAAFDRELEARWRDIVPRLKTR